MLNAKSKFEYFFQNIYIQRVIIIIIRFNANE